jgi:antitoxin YqcF
MLATEKRDSPVAKSAENKALARYLRETIGGRSSIYKFLDEAKEGSVDIFCAEDVPQEGISTAATLGLSDASIDLEVDGKPLGVELLMSFRTAQGDGENILATCAFNVINSGMIIRPGIIFPGVVAMYRSNSPMRHILFADPYLWDLETKHFSTKVVAWLIAVPISDAELEFARARGSGDDLSSLLAEKAIDEFDLDRHSVI